MVDDQLKQEDDYEQEQASRKEAENRCGRQRALRSPLGRYKEVRPEKGEGEANTRVRQEQEERPAEGLSCLDSWLELFELKWKVDDNG